jgi:inhibitor of cysteine peptidase
MQKEITKRIRLYGIAAVLLAVILVSVCYQLGYVPQIQLPKTSPFMSTFSSYNELKDFLKNKTQSQYTSPYYTRNGGVFIASGPQGKFLPGITNSLSATDLTHSGTNIQVTGVDEADFVKVDNNGYIFVLAGNNVTIVKAYPPEEAQVASRITFTDMSPSGIFVNGDKLAVLGSNYSMVPLPYYGLPVSPGITGPYSPTTMYSQDVTTYVKIFDISNRTNPTLLETFSTSGYYLSSRMIGNYVYLVAGQLAYYKVEVLPNITVDKVNLPSIGLNGTETDVSSSDIYYSNVTDNYFTFTTIAAVNIENVTETPSSKTLLIGGTSTLYVSLNNIYITQNVYDQTDFSGQTETSIYRIHVENSTITPEAKGTVPGSILNQYSMDEFGDYFRVVTTGWGSQVTSTGPTTKSSNGTVTIIPTPFGGQESNVYVLDMNLSIVGRLENLSQGENFHSARFMGNKCYLVTFMMTDPLFVIDLSNPAKPSQLGNLTIPGYSDYLHPYDENHLIGIGKETTASENGYFAWYQGVKISLFDVSNVSMPIQIANYTIGERGTTSPVLSDPKAFLFDKSKNLLVIPVLVAEVDQSQYPPGQVPAGAYGQPVWQGAYVFNISLDGGLTLEGKISHMENGIDIYNQDYYVQRSLYIGNVLYTISEAKIRLNSLDNLALIKEIEIG